MSQKMILMMFIVLGTFCLVIAVPIIYHGASTLAFSLGSAIGALYAAALNVLMCRRCRRP